MSKLAQAAAPTITFTTPQTAEQLTQTRALFREYAESLGIDLSFQHFEKELANLPGDYASPRGALILAYHGHELAGCCALRPTQLATHPNTAEMKRLYVKPTFRSQNLGESLANRIISEAKTIGYAAMLLDTLPNMTRARALYRALGFKPIAPYYDNPIPSTEYLKLTLS